MVQVSTCLQVQALHWVMPELEQYGMYTHANDRNRDGTKACLGATICNACAFVKVTDENNA